jgi:hypothetical protein
MQDFLCRHLFQLGHRGIAMPAALLNGVLFH